MRDLGLRKISVCPHVPEATALRRYTNVLLSLLLLLLKFYDTMYPGFT